MMKAFFFLLCFIFASAFHFAASAQWKGRQAPSYLTGEIFRMSKDCYYFNEFLLIKQNNKHYVVVSFLHREAMGNRLFDTSLAKPVSACGKRLNQVRLYRWVSDQKAIFKDSLFVNTFNVALGNASDFDQSGTTKVMINHICNPPQGSVAPLLCYAFSIVEITKREKFRSVLSVGNVPERFVNGQPLGIPLEPVVSDNFDKTPYPECLAIDDFFEGDFAFRPDDLPTVTLIYSWDAAAKVYKNRSDKFRYRFSVPASIDSLPEEISLIEFMKNVMSIAAVGKPDHARKYLDLGMTTERIEQWKAMDPTRAHHIELDRLRSKLLTCIARYTLHP